MKKSKNKNSINSNEKEEIKDNLVLFIKKSKVPILVIIFFLILAYGGRLTNSSFSIDTELYMKNYADNYTWWMSLNRWALVIFNKFTSMSNLLIPQANFLTVTLILVYSILFNYLFYLNIDNNYDKAYYKLQFIFPCIMLTSPIFAEMYNFAILNVGIAAGICMIAISLIIYEKIESKKLPRKTKIAIIAICILVTSFAFGIYQAIVPLYLFIVAACYLLKCIKEKNSSYKWLIRQIIFFCSSALIYLIICKLFCPPNSYLNSGWSTRGLQCFKDILYVINETINCDTIYYNISYLIAILFIILINGYLIFKKKINFGIILGSIGVILAPYYINFITGAVQLKRTQFNYPFCIAFIFLLFALLIKSKNYKYIYYFLIILTLGISYKQAMISGNLFYSDEVRYQNDVLLADKIQTMIEEKDWYDKDIKYTMILIGKIENKANNSYQKGEVMGYSFFEFDSLAHYGVSTRVPAFMETLGYYYKGPSSKEFDKAKEYIKENNIPSYPNKDCIILDDNKIIIRLSDEFE